MPGQGKRMRKFKCRWCGEQFPVYTHSQDDEVGPRVYGGDRLVEHCENEHPREVEALRRALGHDEPVRMPNGESPDAGERDDY